MKNPLTPFLPDNPSSQGSPFSMAYHPKEFGATHTGALHVTGKPLKLKHFSKISRAIKDTKGAQPQANGGPDLQK